MRAKLAAIWGLGFVLSFSAALAAQDLSVSAKVSLMGTDHVRVPKPQNVVLWLTRLDAGTAIHPASWTAQPLRLIQKNKQFHPHILVVPVGAVVAFPNHDPFFHNVFSLFEGKRFDLGLYEAGSSRNVHFDKPGISYIFCNIHPEMSAVVIALETPYHGISNAKGQVVIPDVPSGRYALHVWYEAALPESLKSLTRDIVVSPQNSSLGTLRLIAARSPQPHKNKYGRDYEPPDPQSPVYDRQ